MRFIGVAAFAAALTASLAQDASFQLFKIADNSFGAACLDGSAPAFYFSPGSGANASNWVWYFQGGGWCYSPADCYGRSLGNLGSSTNLPATGTIGGLLSNSPSVGPLAGWTKVWMAYCDGNSFSGDRAEPLIYDNGKANVSLFFRGRANIDAIVDAVSKNVMNAPVSMVDAENVVITGCSAGGLATYLHADYLAAKLPHSGQVLAAPISGYFLNYVGVTGAYTYGTQIAETFAMSNASTNADCQAAYAGSADAYHCNMAQYVYPFVKTPIFALNSIFDSWQTGCILTAEPVTPGSEQNGNCSAAPGWTACAQHVENCTDLQITDGYVPFGQYMTTSFLHFNAAKSSAPGNGGFLNSCHYHCEAQSDAEFANIAIDGTTMSAAVRSWLEANLASGNKAPAASHWYSDCLYVEGGNHQCNPTCPNS